MGIWSMSKSVSTLVTGLFFLCFGVIVAGQDGDVRLIGGSSYEGRVELFYAGGWYTVCDDGWDTADATVVCRQLGYKGSAEALGSAHFGAGSDQIILDDVNCGGWESTLLECPNPGLFVHNCQHTEDAGVRCSSDGAGYGDVRLSGGLFQHEGRVEIFYDNEWGTICDDLWVWEDAEVVCRQLGYSGVSRLYDRAYFGEGNGSIMKTTGCNGYESYWLQCSYTGWDTRFCYHSEDAGVTCLLDQVTPIDGDVRLAGSTSDNSGRVEIYYEGEWGTICDHYWSYYDATVICRQLGYDGVETYYSGSMFGQGSGAIMRNLGCLGKEWFWHDCPFSDWETSLCTHSEDAAVTCSTPDFNEGSVRLLGASSEFSGRVEVYHSREWGSVCDDGWGMKESDVVCRQLGYPAAIAYEGTAYYGEGSGPVMLDDVKCDGSEYMLTQCHHDGWYTHDCNHGEDVGVTCRIPVTHYPRLVDGLIWYEGRVEVWNENRWERMCDQSFYADEASVVCRQLGFHDYEQIFDGNPFGVGTAPPSEVLFDCESNDDELCDCVILDAGNSLSCGSVSVRCQHQGTGLSGGAIAGIVIASVFAFICIGACLSLTCQSSKSKRKKCTSIQPTVAVISGVDNPAGPPASQLGSHNVTVPPSYDDVMHNPMYYPQHVNMGPTMQIPFPPQQNVEMYNPQATPSVHTNSKSDFPYPVEIPPGTTHHLQLPSQPTDHKDV